MQFVDSHCHIDLPEFDADRAQVLARCQQLGVQSIVVPGVNLPAAQTPAINNVYRAVGLHPWWLPEFLQKSSINDIEAYLSEAIESINCVAIGESGLDRPFAAKRGRNSFALQVESLKVHIRVANKAKLPLILHSVKTHADILNAVNQQAVVCGGVIHGFSGSLEIAQALVAKGFKIGVGGTITYPRAKKTRDAVKGLAQEDLLLETDAPSMPLCGLQGQRNSPECIVAIARELAALRGETLEEVARYTSENAKELFGIL